MSTNSKSKDQYVWLRVGLVFVVAWVVYLRFFGPRDDHDGLLPPELVGTGTTLPADYSWVLQDLEGKPVEFSRFRGKAVVLNIWATWCPPCVMEMPALAELAANPKLQGQPVEVVCVSVDENLSAPQNFMKNKDWKMTILQSNNPPEVFASEAIPATYLIAPDGRIDVVQLGSAAWDHPSVVARMVKLAGEAGQKPAS